MTEDQVKDTIRDVHENFSEEELRKLAADYVEGKIFTSMQIRQTDADMIYVIFMPLMFIKEGGAWIDNAAFLFAEMERASQRSVNGYPSFFHVRKVTKHDYPAFCRYVDDYKAMKEQFFSAPPPDQI